MNDDQHQQSLGKHSLKHSEKAAAEWEKRLAFHVSDSDLVSKICKEPLQLKTKKDTCI